MPQVNRQLKDAAFDHIDHALGRPLNPLTNTSRNYFAVGEGADADSFRVSPHWRYDGTQGDMLYFSVTTAGRKALRDHLTATGGKNKVFEIEWGGIRMTQVATSRERARYRKWLSVSDVSDVSFKDFMATARIRLA